MKLLLTLVAVMAASSASAQVRFRVPLRMDANTCGSGRCAPTAYYDTSRSWGWVSDWACGGRTYNQHDGTDYGIGGFGAMDQGRWVVSAAAGTVIATHDGEFDRCTSGNCGTANYIQIRHSDGKVTWYWHLKRWSIRVRVGQRVACNTLLAQAGSSGLSTGPHLHFGVWVPGYGMDDPYGSPGGRCGGSANYWVSQGPYGGMPSWTCQ